jgi:hypothetical protein
MKRRAIIATHHKTGTVWMLRLFTRLSNELAIPLVEHDRRTACTVSAPAIVIDRNAYWFAKKNEGRREDDRFLHVVRDPRDVVISAMHYHRHAAEIWLHAPQPSLGGRTYQEALNAEPDDFSRLVFEMDHHSGKTIRAMAAWDYHRSECFEARYEDLVADVDNTLFTRIFRRLGFTKNELDVCRDELWKTALFGRKKRLIGKHPHIRAGHARQWETEFNRALGEAFVERHGAALIALGYERDHSWLDRLPAALPARTAQMAE